MVLCFRARLGKCTWTIFFRCNHRVIHMIKKTYVLALLCAVSGSAFAQTMTLTTSNADYQITNTFSQVSTFNIRVEIDSPLAPGAYLNPDIVDVTYQVTGALAPGTPSGFAAFDLQRTMTGDEFYAQGSSLSFEIAPGAVLSDGVQVTELVGNDIVLTFDGREIDNGRFHPALFELRANGSGRIQNSNNIPSVAMMNDVEFGEEYITDLMFDPGNTTVITGAVPSGGGAIGALEAATILALLATFTAIRRRRSS